MTRGSDNEFDGGDGRPAQLTDEESAKLHTAKVFPFRARNDAPESPSSALGVAPSPSNQAVEPTSPKSGLSSDGQHVFTYHGHAAWVRTLKWSPQGTYIASASDSMVHVWRPEMKT